MCVCVRVRVCVFVCVCVRVCACAHTPPGRWLLKASGWAKGRITSRLSATNHFPSAQPPCLPACLSVCRSVCLFSPPPQAAVCLHHSYVLCLTTRLETFHWSSFRQRAEILHFSSYVADISTDLFWQTVSESQFYSYKSNSTLCEIYYTLDTVLSLIIDWIGALQSDFFPKVAWEYLDFNTFSTSTEVFCRSLWWCYGPELLVLCVMAYIPACWNNFEFL